MRRSTIATALTGSLLLAGCAAPQPAGSPPAPFDPGKAISDLRTRQAQAEQAVADCMAGQGFDYRPAPPDEQLFSGRVSVLLPTDDVRAFRRRHGFGAGTRTANPNNAIRAALPPPRRAAYDQALSGTPDASGNPSFGCQGQAAAAQPPPPAEPDPAAYAAFQTDPQLIDAAHTYATCLRTHGYRIAPADEQPGRIEIALSQHEQGVKAALTDLDCRTGYAIIARTQHARAILWNDGF
ncbi:hypothetical protein [Actinoplanes sp. N902-109]|uniref:hypothetical protein n=1 Tax=Actinoplanes sp. (strain N902-109) TaxID=649831 RepID=UPI00032936F6|nr:hypothetical protein [Actinoplanes sp. N902-109]AGL15800.1 hypothetical protein L083_2290 [Actinoplanes sp. N902-109]